MSTGYGKKVPTKCDKCIKTRGHLVSCSTLKKCDRCKELIKSGTLRHHNMCKFFEGCSECGGVVIGIETIGHYDDCLTVPKCDECSGRMDVETVGHNDWCSIVPKCTKCEHRTDRGWVSHDGNCESIPRCEECDWHTHWEFAEHYESCSHYGIKKCHSCGENIFDDITNHSITCSLPLCNLCDKIGGHDKSCYFSLICHECGGLSDSYALNGLNTRCVCCGCEIYL